MAPPSREGVIRNYGTEKIEHFRKSCRQVLSRRPGSAFFVSKNILLTCNHVLDGCQNDAVMLRDWIRNCTTTEKILHRSADLDIALIGSSNQSEVWLEFGTEVSTNDSLIGIGFPNVPKPARFDSFTATFEAITCFDNLSGYLLKFKSGHVEPGYSGGPLIRSIDCRIIGVIRLTRDERFDLGG